MSAVAPSIKDQLTSERFSRTPERAPEVDEFATLPDNATFPDREAVSRVAYGYWEERSKNNVEGSAEGDWYRAEQDFLATPLR
jgi:hypothetical protein